MLLGVGIYAAAYCYYRFVLMHRPGGWKLRGPEDIDAATQERQAE